MHSIIAVEVGLWPTHLHVLDGMIQGAVAGVLRVPTIALGLKRDRS